MEKMSKERKKFVDSIEKGSIVAFTQIDQNKVKRMLSGTVLELHSNSFVVQTRNGSIFFPKCSEIVWVKTGSRWPIGIYNALKYSK